MEDPHTPRNTHSKTDGGEPRIGNGRGASSNDKKRREDPRDRYELLEKIGKGGYGYVCRAWDIVEEKYVAVKIINLEDAGDEVDDVHQEISVMSNIDCKQLTKYHTSFVVGENLWIIMEYLEAGSLLDIIKDMGPLPERFVAYIMKELLLALQYLHSERKIHRDIKAGNLLVSGEGAIKLADFGVTGQLTDSMNKRQTKIGTPFWMAPEVISQSSYDGCADIWSTGITAIELCKGTPPYANKIHPFQAILLIPKNPPPVLEGDEFSAVLKDFVAHCLVKSPAERPDASQLLEHPFVAQAEKLPDWEQFIQDTIAERQRKLLSRSQDAADGSSCGGSDNDTGEWNFTQRTQTQLSHGHTHTHSGGAFVNSNSSLRSNSYSSLNRGLSRQDSLSRSHSNSQISLSRSNSNVMSRASSFANNFSSRNSSGRVPSTSGAASSGAAGGGAGSVAGSSTGRGSAAGDSPITLESLEYYSSDGDDDGDGRSATPPKLRTDGTPRSQQKQQQFFASPVTAAERDLHGHVGSGCRHSSKRGTPRGGKRDIDYEHSFPTAYPPNRGGSATAREGGGGSGSGSSGDGGSGGSSSGGSSTEGKKLERSSSWSHSGKYGRRHSSREADSKGGMAAGGAGNSSRRRMGYELTPPRTPTHSSSKSRGSKSNYRNSTGTSSGTVSSAAVTGGVGSGFPPSYGRTQSLTVRSPSPGLDHGGSGSGVGGGSALLSASGLHCVSNDTIMSSGTATTTTHALKHAVETIQEMQGEEELLRAQVRELRAENARLKKAAAPYFSALNVLLRHWQRVHHSSGASLGAGLGLGLRQPRSEASEAMSSACAAAGGVEGRGGMGVREGGDVHIAAERAAPARVPLLPLSTMHDSRAADAHLTRTTDDSVPRASTAASAAAAPPSVAKDGVAAIAATSPLAPTAHTPFFASHAALTAASVASLPDIISFICHPPVTAGAPTRIRRTSWGRVGHALAAAPATAPTAAAAADSSSAPASTKAVDAQAADVSATRSLGPAAAGMLAIERSRSDSSEAGITAAVGVEVREGEDVQTSRSNSDSLTPRTSYPSSPTKEAAAPNSTSTSISTSKPTTTVGATGTGALGTSSGNGVGADIDSISALLQALERYDQGSQLFQQVVHPSLRLLAQQLLSESNSRHRSASEPEQGQQQQPQQPQQGQQQLHGRPPMRSRSNSADSTSDALTNAAASAAASATAATSSDIISVLNTVLCALDALHAPPHIRLITADSSSSSSSSSSAGQGQGSGGHSNTSRDGSNGGGDGSSNGHNGSGPAVPGAATVAMAGMQPEDLTEADRCGGWTLELLSLLTAHMAEELGGAAGGPSL